MRPGLVVGLAMAMVGAGVAPVALAWATKVTLEGIVEDASIGELVGPLVGLAVAGVVMGIASPLGGYASSELGRATGVAGQDRLFGALERLHGLARFENPRFLDTVSLAQGPGRSAPAWVLSGSLGLVQALITWGGFVVALAVVDARLTAVVVLSALPVLGAELLLARRRADAVQNTGYAVRREMFFGLMLRDPRAAQEIRLHGTGGYLRGLLLRESRRIADAHRRVERLDLLVQSALALLAAAIATGALVWAIGGALAGDVGVGDVTLVVAATAALQAGSAQVVAQVAGTRESLLLFGHFHEVVTLAPDLPLAAEPVPVPALADAIAFENVWFRYGESEPWVLRGVDLVLPAGRATALVGVNGAGKSTIVKLLCRLYDPSRGRITWDGVDLRYLDPAELRRRIGVVFQDFMHYDLSAHENVALGDLTALGDRGRVRRAAATVGLDEVLAGLPQGYDTVLSRTFVNEQEHDDPSNGLLLSGGQWQRVAIARAMLREDAALAVLDEPSAGLDVEAEAELAEALRRRREGRTSVLVSHRLSTIRDADQIVVLENGRVRESGTHDELVACEGRYCQLFTLQSRGYHVAGAAIAGSETGEVVA